LSRIDTGDDDIKSVVMCGTNKCPAIILLLIIIMSRQFLRRRNTVTDSRAPYKPQTNTKDTVHAAVKI